MFCLPIPGATNEVLTLTNIAFSDQGVYVLAGTPQPVIDRLAKEVLAIMRKPEVREKMLKASFEVKPEGPQALAARIAREVPMWKDIVDKAGLKTN